MYKIAQQQLWQVTRAGGVGSVHVEGDQVDMITSIIKIIIIKIIIKKSSLE